MHFDERVEVMREELPQLEERISLKHAAPDSSAQDASE